MNRVSGVLPQPGCFDYGLRKVGVDPFSQAAGDLQMVFFRKRRFGRFRQGPLSFS